MVLGDFKLSGCVGPQSAEDQGVVAAKPRQSSSCREGGERLLDRAESLELKFAEIVKEIIEEQ